MMADASKEIPRDTKTSTSRTNRERILIMGAAGRDFHNFNVCFRDNPEYDVVAFTAAQIPGIEDRCHVATPVDLARLIAFSKPHYRVRYDLEEISHPDLAEIMSSFLHNHR